LRYVDSWVEADRGRCFQLMEADDATLFPQWVAAWQDLVDFEILPVVKSSEAAESAQTEPIRNSPHGNEFCPDLP